MSDSRTISTVWVVDDDDGIRHALARGLTLEGFQVECWASADEFLAQHDASRPGCLVTDVRMPGTDGMELQRLLAERDISIPTVFLSGHGSIAMSVQAMRAGAVSFLQKPVRLDAVIAAVREALARDLEARSAREVAASIRSRIESLTRREREVLQLVIAGKLNKQIAAELGASAKTIKVHRAHLMSKMKVRSVAQLVSLDLMIRASESGLPAVVSAASSALQLGRISQREAALKSGVAAIPHHPVGGSSSRIDAPCRSTSSY